MGISNDFIISICDSDPLAPGIGLARSLASRVGIDAVPQPAPTRFPEEPKKLGSDVRRGGVMAHIVLTLLGRFQARMTASPPSRVPIRKAQGLLA